MHAERGSSLSPASCAAALSDGCGAPVVCDATAAFSRTSSSCVGVRWSTSSPGSNQIARLFRRGVGARDGAPEATWALSRLGRRGPPCCRPLMPCESSSSRPAALAPAQYFSHYARWEFVRFIPPRVPRRLRLSLQHRLLPLAFLQPSRLAGMAIIWTMRRIFRAAAPITNRKRRTTTCKSSGGRRVVCAGPLPLAVPIGAVGACGAQIHLDAAAVSQRD